LRPVEQRFSEGAARKGMGAKKITKMVSKDGPGSFRTDGGRRKKKLAHAEKRSFINR